MFRWNMTQNIFDNHEMGIYIVKAGYLHIATIWLYQHDRFK